MAWALGYGSSPPPWVSTLMQAQEWALPPWEVRGEPNQRVNRLRWQWRWQALKAAQAARQKKDEAQWAKK